MALAKNESEATRILRDVARDREETWGFFFYRTCYYNDDTRWESFLERMKEFAESTLLKPRSYNKDGGGQILLSKLECNVQSYPALDGCSKEEIWRYEKFQCGDTVVKNCEAMQLQYGLVRIDGA
jgi:hypothetical protein